MPVSAYPPASTARHQSLAIGCFASLCRERLSEPLLSFARAQPGIAIGVRELGLAALELALASSEIALAVTPAEPRPGERSILLWQDRVALAMAADDPWATRDCISPDMLDGSTVFVPQSGEDWALHRYLRERALAHHTVRAKLHDGDLGALIGRVVEGEARALVGARSIAAVAGLVVRPIAGEAAWFAVRAVWRPAAPGSPLDLFCRHLQAELGPVTPEPFA